MAAAKTLTKQQRVDRARKAALARTTPESAIKMLEGRYSELSDEQLSRLAMLIIRAGSK
jgi:hypothetical protein